MRLLCLVPPGDDPEATGAVAWGRAMGFDVRAVPMIDGSAPPPVAPDEIPWCHAGGAVPSLPTGWGEALAAWVHDGGRMLLTLLAAPLASALGAPGALPRVERPRPWRHDDDPLWPASFRDWPDYPHIRGLQGWGAHPLFAGMGRGTYTWSASEGEPVARCTFRRPAWPEGAVLAVERAYVALDAGDAVAWSYDVGAGHLLCLGANIVLAARSRRLAPQRDALLVNALALLDRARDWRSCTGAAWPRATGGLAGVVAGAGGRERFGDAAGRNAGSALAVDAAGGLAPPVLVPLATPGDAPLVMSGAARAGAPFTLAGRRALVVGDEGWGVQEVWLHPLCALSEGVQLTVDGEEVTPLEVRVTPQSLVRTVADGRGRRWREVVAVSPERAVVRYEAAPLDAAPGAVATLSAQLRVRLQWPMPAQALWPLVARRVTSAGRVVLCVESAVAPVQLRLAGDGVATCDAHLGEGRVEVTLTGAPGGGIRMALAGDADGAAALAPAWREVQGESLGALLERLAALDARRGAATVQLTTDSPLDTAWAWAKGRLASFIVAVPGVGTGMTAGYAASRPGWGDSRPGYGWFFGRDACWSGDALLAAGLFDEARVALEFLAATADLTGKIAHEVTTSGVRHYDAADATPLWLRFAARYAAWTGDRATVRALHGAIVRAVDFVRSTDQDGDGLPDNTGVGHGWIESGPLGGGALTAYTAAIWIDALRRLLPVARWLGDPALEGELRVALERAEPAFEHRLRDPATGRVYLQRRAAPGDAANASHASDAADDAFTALSAVPVLLGVDQHPTADEVVARLADDDFCTAWGVRLVSRRDARYRPRGYHEGAVWPLYTGWASLASYARARPELGWRHLRAVADAAFHRERGAFDEVLDGDTGAAAGICPDQAWSAAMVITPLVDGMLGMVPWAPGGRCTLAPQWPSAWRAAQLRALRVGGSRFSLAMRREGEALHYTLVLESGPTITVQLAGAGASPAVLRAGVPVQVTRPAARGDDVRR